MKPILFSTPMVQAILDGRKMMTRRVITNVNFQPWVNAGFTDEFIKAPENGLLEKAPIKAGDVLWVRETFTVMYPSLPNGRIDYDHEDVFYAANKLDAYTVKTTCVLDDDGFDTGRAFPWKPSIFMPLKYSRIFLRVTEVRAERLQDMTEEDARAEGVRETHYLGVDQTARAAFHDLWNKLNAARGYGWDKNPWVWIYTFERITREEAMEAST